MPSSKPARNQTAALASSQNRVGGLGEGFSRAFEFAATPAIFAGMGYLVDRAIGTKPWAMVGFAVFGTIGMFTKMWFDYDRSMKNSEAEAIAARKAANARHVAQTKANSPIQFDENAVNHEVSDGATDLAAAS